MRKNILCKICLHTFISIIIHPGIAVTFEKILFIFMELSRTFQAVRNNSAELLTGIINCLKSYRICSFLKIPIKCKMLLDIVSLVNGIGSQSSICSEVCRKSEEGLNGVICNEVNSFCAIIMRWEGLSWWQGEDNSMIVIC